MSDADCIPFGTVVGDSLGSVKRHSPAFLDVGRLIGTHMVVQGNAGAGKSRTFRKIAEATHGRVQHIFLDVEDEYYTLRERFDYIIAGGDNGDCPATPANAAQLALVLLEHGLSAIVQLNTLPLAQRRQFVGLFLESAMAAPRELWHPVLFFQDEADRYAPQAGKVESSAAIVALMDQGRKRGFTGILATQRVAKIDKDALGSANNWMIGRVGQALDRRAGADALGFSPSSDEARGLQALAPGHFWSFGPALSPTPELVHVGDVATTHLRTGDARVPTPPPAAALKEILGALAAAAAPPAATSGSPPSGKPGNESVPTAPARATADEIAAAERRGWERGAAATLEASAKHFGQVLDRLAQELQRTLQTAEREVDEAVSGRWSLTIADDVQPVALPAPAPASATEDAAPGPAAAEGPVGAPQGDDAPSDGAIALLDVLVRSHPMPLPARLWGAFAGKSPTSGWWRAQMNVLRGAGLIVADAGGFLATPAGIAAATVTPARPKDELALWALWRDRMREIVGAQSLGLLAVLARFRDHRLTAEQWGLLAGDKSPTSGWWRATTKVLSREECAERVFGRFGPTAKGLAILGDEAPPVERNARAVIRAAREAKLAAKSQGGARLYAAWRDGMTRRELAAAAGDLSMTSGYWRGAIKDLLSAGLVDEVDGRLRRATEDLLDA
jgi:hypothetical protein